MKLTMTQATNLIMKANEELKKNPHLRFGQALFNLLPSETAETFRGTEHDIFYVRDHSDVLVIFYDNYVNLS